MKTSRYVGYRIVFKSDKTKKPLLLWTAKASLFVGLTQ